MGHVRRNHSWTVFFRTLPQAKHPLLPKDKVGPWGESQLSLELYSWDSTQTKKSVV